MVVFYSISYAAYEHASYFIISASDK